MISIFDSRLKRLSMLAEKRRLDYQHMQEFNTFLVTSYRKGHAPHRVRIEDENLFCSCEAGEKDLACSHMALICKQRFPHIAYQWDCEDIAGFHLKRQQIKFGLVGSRELARYRRAYREFLSSEMEVAA